MAQRAGLFSNPLLEVENDPYAGTVNPHTGINPAEYSGFAGQQPGMVDQAIAMRQQVMENPYGLGGGFATPSSAYEVPSVDEILSGSQPEGGVPIRLGYDPDRRQYLVNDTVIDADDYNTLQRVPELLQSPPTAQAPEGNWRPMDLDTLKRNKDALLDIGVTERLRLGTQGVAGSIPRGVGRGLEMLGLDAAGEALVDLGDAIGPSEYDQARQGAVSEANNLFQNIAGAIPEGAPSFATSIASGIAGAKVGFAVGGPGGAAVGGVLGAAATLFPMMLDSAYSTALRQQGEEFVESPEGKAQVLGTTLATTWVQTFAPAMITSRFMGAVNRAANNVAQQAVRDGVFKSGAKVGFTEGMAELSALIIEQAAFDPETRRMMSEGDVQALFPYIARTYGEDAAVAWAAGAVLGGGAGSAVAFVDRPSAPPAGAGAIGDGDTTPPSEGTPPPAAPEELATPPESEDGNPAVVPLEPYSGGIPAAGSGIGLPRYTQVDLLGMDRGTQLEMGVTGGRATRPASPNMGPVAPDEGQLLDPRQMPLFGEPEMATQLRDRLVERERQQAVETSNRLLRQQRQREFDAAQEQVRLQEEADWADQQRRAEAVEDDVRSGIDLLRRQREPAPEAVPQQLNLFDRNQAPRLSRGEQLRRGLQPLPQTQGDPFVVPEPEVAPRQGVLLRQDGEPTVAAQRRAQQSRQAVTNADEIAQAEAAEAARAAGAPAAGGVVDRGRQPAPDPEPIPTVDPADIGTDAGSEGVVDTVVYHGGPESGLSRVRAFDIGIHAGSQDTARNVVQATGEGSIYPLELKGRVVRVSDPDGTGAWHNPETVAATLSEAGIALGKKAQDAIRRWQQSNEYGAIVRAGAIPPRSRQAEALRAIRMDLRDKGIDGLVYENQFEGGGDSFILVTDSRTPAGEAETITAPKPEVIGEPELFGKAETNDPFKTEFAAVGQKKNVSLRTGIPASELEAVETDGGFYLQRSVEDDAIQERGAAPVSTPERTGTGPEVGSRVPEPVPEPVPRQAARESTQEAQEATDSQAVRETDLDAEPDVDESSKPLRADQYTDAEDAWNNMKSDDMPAFAELPFKPQQTAWAALFGRGVHSTEFMPQILAVRDPIQVEREDGTIEIWSVDQLAQEMANPDELSGMSDKEFIEETIARTEEATNNAYYREGIADLFEWLYNYDPNLERNGSYARIVDFLGNLPVDTDFRKAFENFARVSDPPLRVANPRTGKLTRVFELILTKGLYDSARKRFGFRHLPKDLNRSAQPLIERGLVTPEYMQTVAETLVVRPETTVDPEDSATPDVDAEPEAEFTTELVDVPPTNPEGDTAIALELANLIDQLNTDEFARNTKQRENKIEALASLYEQVSFLEATGFEDAYGVPLWAYFDDKGQPRVTVTNNVMRVTRAPEFQNVQARKTVDDFDLDDTLSDAEIGDTLDSLGIDLGDGNFMTDDGSSISRTMPPSRVRMLLNTFKNKLKVRPKTFVFRNQADLKQRAPDLYRRAVDARPQGDFDTVSGVGYSFGSGADATVIIFSDRILTRRQLNFVMAHETLGHFGMRSLIPQVKFAKLMDSIYRESATVRKHVDAAMNINPKLQRAVAVEEYLADYAANLDVNLISRIMAAIKNALNKLGVEFADDAARYLVSQSRRYVRNGDRSAFFRASEMLETLNAIESGQDPFGTGRFSVAGTLRGDNQRAADIVSGLMSDVGVSVEGITEGSKKAAKTVATDLTGGWDNFKNKYFNLLVYRARENAGLSAVHDVVSESRDIAMSIRKEMQEKMAPVLDRAMLDRLSGVRGVGGATKTQVETINNFLYEGMRRAINTNTRMELGSARLFVVDSNGNVIQNEAEVKRLFDMGTLTFEQMRDGFSYELEYQEAGETVTETVNVDGIPDLTRDSTEWKGYLSTREAVRDVELKLLRARNIAYTKEREYSFREIALMMQDEMLVPADRQFLERAYRKYKDIWTADQVMDDDGNLIYNPESIDSANKFLAAFNAAIIANDSAATDAEALKRIDKLAEYYQPSQYESLYESVEGFKARKKKLSGDDRFIAQNKIKDIIVSDLSDSQADLFTKQTLASGYVPLVRRGGYEVSIHALDRNGNRVVLGRGYKEQLAYRQFESEGEAVNTADQMNKDLFGDGEYTVEVFDPATQESSLKKVTLEAVPGVVLDAPAAPPQLNLNEFIHGLRRFNIPLNPTKMEKIVLDLTAQNNRARKRLRRKDVPGYDKDAIRAVAEHVETRASTIAKIMMKPRLAELTNLKMKETRKLWHGDPQKLARMKQKWENETDENRKAYYGREYAAYKLMYDKTNPEGKANRAMQYFNEASNLLQFIENNRDLNESDFGSRASVSAIRAATSIFQLGASFATAALNYVAIPTNVIPYLSSHNSDTGFGGGFNIGSVMREMNVAFRQVGAISSVRDTRLNTAEFYDQMVDRQGEGTEVLRHNANAAELRKQYGLENHEALFIANEIREGTMIPAQMNMLTELALGRIPSAAARKTIEGYMWTFNASERATRRSVGLAAYRLEYNRRKSAGYSHERAALEARKMAVDTLRMGLGEYSVTNRPAAWRSGLQSFLYIYKIFPTTSIQLLSRMSRGGQLSMLAMLLAFSGVSGLPFAEDLEDMVDTIAQGLNLKMGSVRKELAKMSDAIIPGSSPWMLSGLMRSFLPGDIASRTSLGDFLPGTAVLLAGSTTTREVAEIAGPAFSMMQGAASFANRTRQAITSPNVTYVDAMRDSPLTAMRMAGDALMYTKTGAVVDRRGYVVSEDMHMGVIGARLLGFYPSSAANQYDVIRISRRIADYQRDVSASFRYGWVKAKVEGDEERAREIREAARQWNKDARGTGLEINTKYWTRSLKEAVRPARERLVRSSPRSARKSMEETARLLGYPAFEE